MGCKPSSTKQIVDATKNSDGDDDGIAQNGQAVNNNNDAQEVKAEDEGDGKNEHETGGKICILH